MAEKKSTKENVKSSFRLIRFFWPQIVREKGLVLLSLGGLALTLALQVVEPWPLKYIYDSIFHVGGKHGRVPLPLADGFSPHAVIAVAALSIVTIVALGAAAEYFCTVYLARATSRI